MHSLARLRSDGVGGAAYANQRSLHFADPVVIVAVVVVAAVAVVVVGTG